MCDWLRGLSDFPFILMLILIGFLMTGLIVTAIYLWEEWKRTLTHDYLKLKRENARLRRQLQLRKRQE